MSHSLDFKKNYFYYILLIYFICGIFLSLNTGITHDEYHSNFVGESNKKLFLNTLFGLNFETKPLEGLNLHYGSGFYFISAPIEYIISFFINLEDISQETKKILIKHPTVFIFFTISGIYFRKILYFINNDKNFSSISTFFYLSYPYLLGHSFFNIKDIPFLSVWLICTFYIIKISKFFYNKKSISYKTLLILAVLTSYLLSLRLSGILIFFEYLIFFIFTINISKFNYFNFLRLFYKQILIFCLTTISIFYLFSPSYWNNPLEVINGVKAMSHHLQTVCTITLGECMKAQNLPSSYIPIWLFFKLPILVLFGFALLIFKEKVFFSAIKNNLIVAPIIISSLFIIFILIFFNVNLYDEIRQVMFLVPLLLICGMSAIFLLPKKFSYSLTIFFIIFFIFQNISIYPYNYIWLNNFSHLTKIEGKFELDYWGVSAKKIAFVLNDTKFNEDECIISNRNRGIKDFLKQDVCFLQFQKLHQNNRRPFYVALMQRGTKKGLPINCTNFHSEKIRINFSQENLILAKVFKCN